MNKILVNNDEVSLISTDEKINVTLSDKFDIYDIVKLRIEVLEDTNIDIEYQSDKEVKMDIVIEVKENVHTQISEIKDGDNTKVQYHYYLNESSNVEIDKFYHLKQVKELDVINLNGKYADIKYNFKTLCKDIQKYDIMVYHNYESTISNIINKGVNIDDGAITFNVTSIVYNGKVNTEIDQNSRIITFNNNKCVINPILLIDENDVIANHSALIGKFSDEELFYLQSRGIEKKEAINLLVKGFMLEGMENEKINKIIDNYWR